MFLTRGDMPHEASWRAWLRAAEGLVPIEAASAALCRPQQPHCHTPAPNLLPHIVQVGFQPWMAVHASLLRRVHPAVSCTARMSRMALLCNPSIMLQHTDPGRRHDTMYLTCSMRVALVMA